MLGFALLYIVLDFPVALGDRRAGSGPAVKRLSVGQRLQHAVLAGTFITLAMTGFAVKYPDSGYAQWLMTVIGGPDNRSLIHRLAAVVFVVNAYWHFAYYLLRYRGPRRIGLGREDWQTVRQTLRFRLGRGARPAPAGKYDWLQKLEYWAGVIGLHVALVTGLLMWFFEWTLATLSYQMFKYAQWIHGWEAILAVGTVALLHGYSTLFSPRVFPMDTSWLNGYKKTRPG